MYLLPIPEAESVGSGCHQGCSLWDLHGKGIPPVALSGPSCCPHFLFFKRTQDHWISAPPNDLNLTELHPKRAYLQRQSNSDTLRLGIHIWHLFKETIQPITPGDSRFPRRHEAIPWAFIYLITTKLPHKRDMWSHFIDEKYWN